jgi:predicted transposase/invertase (TIGR01784 family)
MEAPLINKPSNHLFFNYIFANKNNLRPLRDILQDILSITDKKLGKLTLKSPILLTKYPDNKQGIVDIKAINEYSQVFHIEIQNRAQEALGQRILFYNCKLVTDQLLKGDNYGNIKKVISIFIANFSFLKDVDGYHHIIKYCDQNNSLLFPKYPEIHILKLQKLPKEPDKSQLWGWLKFLGAKTMEDLNMASKSNPAVKIAADILLSIPEDDRVKDLIEVHEKIERDYHSSIIKASKEGKEEGIKI